MSDLVLKRDTDGWTHVLPAVGDLASKISQTEFVPEAMRGKPAVVAAAILYGRELGLAPMTSLRSVIIIKGRPALSAEAMRAMVLAAGHDIRFQEMTGARCVMVGRRKGQEETTTVTFTMDDAKKMGVGGGAQYSKMPRQMLAARATSELCRLIFADVIGGLISDVEAEDTDNEPLASVAPITTARRKAKASPDPVPADPAEAPVAEPQADPEPVLDDDVIDAEIVEDEPEPVAEPVAEPEPVADTPEIALLKQELDAVVVSEYPSGPALLRQALKEHQAGEPPKAGPISPSQLKALQAGFKDCGIDDRDERLAVAARLAGRDITSANDLNGTEAKAVLDGLAHAKTTEDPALTLKAGF